MHVDSRWIFFGDNDGPPRGKNVRTAGGMIVGRILEETATIFRAELFKRGEWVILKHGSFDDCIKAFD